jgi:PHP family Zn ribbon phosphoesterase
MNMKWLVVAMVMGTYTVIPAVMANEAEHEESEEAGKMVMPDSLKGVWHEIKEHQESLSKVISDNKLDEVHHVAFMIRDLANELPKYSTDLSADNTKKLTTWLAGVADSAEKLDGFGDAGDKAGTEKEANRMNILLGSIEKLYPAQAEATAVYTCSMHPEIVQNGPGKCPKCGMDLIPKDK